MFLALGSGLGPGVQLQFKTVNNSMKKILKIIFCIFFLLVPKISQFSGRQKYEVDMN